MPGLEDKLIVALDVDRLDKAKELVDKLYPTVKLFKVGSSLFPIHGLEVIKMIGAKGGKVFLDLKSLDIPNTVSMSLASGTAYSVIDSVPVKMTAANSLKETVSNVMQYPIFMMTVHSLGGIDMLKAAVQGARNKAAEIGRIPPYIVGVTVLTSEVSDENTSKRVLERARVVKDAGLDGVVCAVSEAAMIRKEFGEQFIIVTPGIRARGYKKDDQSRVATAQEAIKAGANYIVIGRPILEAKDPLGAVEQLISKE